VSRDDKITGKHQSFIYHGNLRYSLLEVYSILQGTKFVIYFETSSMRNKLVLLSIISLALFCCKKKDSEVKTKTTLVSQQSWKFNDAGVDQDKNGTIDTDISGFVSACLKDNIVSFASNGSGTSDEGATKCNSSDPQTVPFTWSFASNETMINITGNAIAGKGGQYKIATLNSTQFSLSKDTTITGFGATTIIVNLKH
jgi:hypothetical protein